MYELRSSIFAPVLRECGVPMTCDDCDRDLDCHTPFGITSKGDPTFRPETDPETAVSWPGCPAQWMGLRRLGSDVVPLAGVVEWAVKRGVHRSRLLGAGGARLCREWIRTHRMVRNLLKARAYEDAKRHRGGR